MSVKKSHKKPVCHNGDKCRKNKEGKCKYYHAPMPLDNKVETLENPEVKPKKTLEEKV